MSCATFSTVSPIIRLDTLQAYSTTSMPRQTSPFASAKVLPVSADTIFAMSSWCRFRSAW